MIMKTLKYTIALLAAASLSFSAAHAAPKGKNVLSLKETITDKNISFPYSFATDTQEMMNNWYLQNYAILDYNVDKKSTVNVSDEEYIRRLKQMPTTIEMPFNQVVRSYIDRYANKSRTLVEQMLGMSLYYMPIFEEALEREGMPLELKYIPVIESAMNPNAVSPAGAAGLWQFMPSTGKGMGLEISTLVDERRDPYKGTEKAVQYFKQLYEIYGDWSLAIAAYNCGPGNVNKAIIRAGGDNPDFWAIYNYLPRETRGYVPAFIAANYVMTYYKEHNISPALAKKPLIVDTVKVNRRVNFNQISQVLNIPIDEIRILNPQYRQDIIPGDIKPYTLALPSQQIYSYVMVEDSIYNYRRDVYSQRTTVEPGGTGYELDDKPYDGSGSSGGVYSSSAGTVPSNTSTYTASSTRSSGGGYEKIHTVQRGESLAGIAFNYGMTPDELIALNGLRTNKVSSGQMLKVIDKSTASNDPVEEMESVTSIRPNDYNSELQAPPKNIHHNNQSQQQTAQVAQPARQQQQTRQQTPPAKPKPSVQQQAQVQQPARQQTYQQQRQQAYQQSYRGRGGYKQQQQAVVAQQQAKKGHGAKQQQQVAGKKGHVAQQAAPAKGGKHGKQAAQPTQIEIKKGDNLTTISKRTGVPVEQLRKANGGKDQIQAGKTLNLNQGKGGKATKQQAAPAKGGKNAKQQAAPAKKGKKK